MDDLPHAPKLTRKQQRFVEEYTAPGPNQGNGLQSALASYNTTMPDTAKVIASQNLTKNNVKSAIAWTQRELQQYLKPERWYRDVSQDIDLARDEGELGVVMRGHQLVAQATGLIGSRDEGPSVAVQINITRE